jgi:hypothetical protein
MVGLSEGEKHFIRGGIAQDLRTDGRRRLQFRALSVQTGVIPQVTACLEEASACLSLFLLFWNAPTPAGLCCFGLVVVTGEWLSAC